MCIAPYVLPFRANDESADEYEKKVRESIIKYSRQLAKVYLTLHRVFLWIVGFVIGEAILLGIGIILGFTFM